MLRIIFMGTPGFAVPTLAATVGAGHEIVAVYTQPPRPAGRGMELKKSPVHVFAESTGATVLTPPTLRSPDADFRQHQADVTVVVAYGLVLPKAVLDAPRYGCLNLHGSALPRWRGATPIQRAIIAGDAGTAVTIMRMGEGLDTGPICLAEGLDIGADETAGQLHDRMARTGADLMVRALAALERGTLDCVPQPAQGACYAPKITKDEARINFTRSAQEVHNLVRGLSPLPGAWFEVNVAGRRERIKVLRTRIVEGAGEPGTVLDAALSIACGSGAVRLLEMQRAGKRPMGAEELLRGFVIPVGTHL